MNLKTAGLMLITVGFLAGSWITVQQVDSVRWSLYAPTFVLAAIGVVLARQGALRLARAADRLQKNIQTVRDCLGRIVANIDDFEAKKADIETHDLRAHIDKTFADDLADFADARESIAHVFGLGSYAEVMNHFAAGERYLNRVWSASVDGYVDECLAYVTHAGEQFREARDALVACQTD